MQKWKWRGKTTYRISVNSGDDRDSQVLDHVRKRAEEIASETTNKIKIPQFLNVNASYERDEKNSAHHIIDNDENRLVKTHTTECLV